MGCPVILQSLKCVQKYNIKNIIFVLKLNRHLAATLKKIKEMHLHFRVYFYISGLTYTLVYDE